MNCSLPRYIASACSCLVLLALVAEASVVSGNNLTSTALPDYATTTNDLISTAFALSGNGLYAVKTTITSSATTGFDMSQYYIAGVSLVTPPASKSDLISSVTWGRTNGVAYPSTISAMIFANTTGATTAYYNLGMGRFDGNKAGKYRWQASANTLYQAAGTDGNLVPNASFENSDVNFFSGGSGTIVSEGVQGSNAWQVDGAADSYIAIPVTVGTTYNVSFWYQSTGSSTQYEYGFSKPENGFAQGVGNTAVSPGLKTWTEVATTFTPGEEQTTWYLGGMSNVGKIQFDSIYVAAIPEPATTVAFMGGGVLLAAFASRRKRN